MGVVVAPPGEEGPRLSLEGFEGPIDLLLELARAQRVDLGRISVLALVEQFVAAVGAAVGAAPLARLGDWLVAASWLLLLRSRLLLPADGAEAEAGRADAARLEGALAEAGAMRGVAAWLAARPALGRDVFARGRPEAFTAAEQGDVLDLLLACFDVYDGPPAAAPAPVRPRPPPLFALAEALERLRAALRRHPEGGELWRFLPEIEPRAPALRVRSGVAAAFLAGLELARRGDVRMEQEVAFGPVSVRAVQGLRP